MRRRKDAIRSRFKGDLPIAFSISRTLMASWSRWGHMGLPLRDRDDYTFAIANAGVLEETALSAGVGAWP